MEDIKHIYSYKFLTIITSLFIIFSVWRIALVFLPIANLDQAVQIWAASYQFTAWVGAVLGFYLSRSWGGYKSLIGRASIAFSIGLLMQSFGQSVFSYYFYSGIELPYPSIADIGFFGSIPFYIYGMMLLAKSSGATISLRSLLSKLQVVIVPAIILGSSYLIFLKDYDFSATGGLQVFLDFGYPLGQAIYISIAILAYTLTRNLLGGMMKKVIIFFIMALVAQYVSDYLFLYQSLHGTFIGGGIVDFLYSTSYFLMGMSLVELGITFEKIKNS